MQAQTIHKPDARNCAMRALRFRYDIRQLREDWVQAKGSE
jgi:hypothetical protein